MQIQDWYANIAIYMCLFFWKRSRVGKDISREQMSPFFFLEKVQNFPRKFGICPDYLLNLQLVQ